MRTRLRSHTCGELRAAHVGTEVRLTGWVDRRRDYGALLFVDLRDRTGKVQVVFEGGALAGAADQELLSALRHEDVIAIAGHVALRAEDAKNPKLATGDIEIRASAVRLLNHSKTPPFEVSAPTKEGDEVASELRMRYRVLDLRRPAVQDRMLFRHKVIKALRGYLEGLSFAEIETPILTKATPEGARDYLVPSRVNPGSFYALPQSPQLFKQLLMIAGYDRYYQVARCFRDEDLRADRQPEFTQLDMEMSFVEQDDVFEMIEGLMRHVFKEALGKELKTPFRRMTYDDVIRRYGIDKPDLRIPLEIVDVTDIAAACEAPFLKEPALHKGGRGSRDGAVRCLPIPNVGEAMTRKDLDGLPDVVKSKGAGGVAWLKVKEGGELQGSVKKFFEGDLGKRLIERTGAKPGHLLLIVGHKNSDITAAALGELRLFTAHKLGLVDKSRDEFLWVTGFPYFEYDAETGGYIACRHPFTSPRPEEVHLLDEDPLKVHAVAYDLVYNGTELGSGSIRIHDPALQLKVLGVLGYSAEESQRRFGFLLESLAFGAPPHGGAAIGLDRFAALLQGLSNLREVVAFPKTAKATCLLTEAPSTVDPDQLKVLKIKVALDEPAAKPAS